MFSFPHWLRRLEGRKGCVSDPSGESGCRGNSVGHELISVISGTGHIKVHCSALPACVSDWEFSVTVLKGILCYTFSMCGGQRTSLWVSGLSMVVGSSGHQAGGGYHYLPSLLTSLVS